MNCKLNSWLSSGEYQVDLDNALTNIVRGASMAESEAETSSVFERELYSLLRFKGGVDVNIHKESSVKGIVVRFDTVKRGRIDAILNDIVIEYKHHSALKTEKDKTKAIRQVEDYLNALRNTFGQQRDAILTDGIRISYFSIVGNEIRHTPLKILSREDLDTMVKAIVNNSTKKFEPYNIVRDFAITADSKSCSKDLADIFYYALTKSLSPRTEMLFLEWQSLMHLSTDDKGKSRDIEKRRADLGLIFKSSIDDALSEYKALFALQTTYAIIVKLIACKVVDKLNLDQDTSGYEDLNNLDSVKLRNFFQRMEDGYSYSSNQLRNFL